MEQKKKYGPTRSVLPVLRRLQMSNWLEECTEHDGGNVTARVAFCLLSQRVPLLVGELHWTVACMQLHQGQSRLSVNHQYNQ